MHAQFLYRDGCDTAASILQPRNMIKLYGSHIVSMLRKDHVAHLLWGKNIDWAEAESQFGQTIAVFYPSRRCWASPMTFVQDERLTVKDLIVTMGEVAVCMMGLDCPVHKEATPQ